MAAFFYDPAYHHYPVHRNIILHVDQKFRGEFIGSNTFAKVKQYLEQLVPGSTWRVYRAPWPGEIEFQVRFDTEEDATMYMLRWA